MPVLNLDPIRLARTAVPIATSWLLASCMEAKGKQDLWIRQKPEVLAVLRERAIVQSAESSNRIEGVTVEPGRLRPVVLGKSRPRDRSEEELAGYRRALDWIFSRKASVAVTPKIIRKLHALAQGGSIGDAGEWKKRNNEIIEILPGGGSRILFVPAAAKDTPRLVDDLCGRYQSALDQQQMPPLLLTATFVFDFLCIHPFRDGNGRVSRLLTTLLLQSHGFQVGRYVSLERLVEETKEDYYRVLAACSQEWRRGKNEILPWWNYFLGIVRSGYKDFESQVTSAASHGAKSDLVRRTVLDQAGEFTLADLAAELPSASPQLIKKVLSELKDMGRMRLIGRGRGAKWTVT